MSTEAVVALRLETAFMKPEPLKELSHPSRITHDEIPSGLLQKVSQDCGDFGNFKIKLVFNWCIKL